MATIIARIRCMRIEPKTRASLNFISAESHEFSLTALMPNASALKEEAQSLDVAFELCASVN
ncbi:MAG: hypothetical protein ACOYXT_18020 [Bacteroidota bacterium]